MTQPTNLNLLRCSCIIQVQSIALLVSTVFSLLEFVFRVSHSTSLIQPKPKNLNVGSLTLNKEPCFTYASSLRLRVLLTVYAKSHNEIHLVVLRNSIMVSTWLTFNIADVQCRDCCRRSMVQAFDRPVSMQYSKRCCQD